MEAEAAVLTQLQLQLLALVSELRFLRERERGAREELRDAGQRWEEAQEEHRREARELRAEVAARDDALRKLEAKIKFLENENELLEKNENNLKESMEVLLQSREAFIKHYEAVADLKDKVQRISVLEKDVVEKLNFLESKISAYQHELRSRARIIYELKDRLEAEKLNNSFQPQLEEISKALLVKDDIIERLTSEKQAMHVELHNMEIALQRFQDLFSSIGHERMKSFSANCGSQDVQDVNNGLPESIPGTQCGLANEHNLVTAIDEAGKSSFLKSTTQNVDCQLELSPGSMQVQSPKCLKSGSLPSPEPVAANTEKADCLPDPKEDVVMGDDLSPIQPTDFVNPEPDSENQP
ncbi:protein CASP [Panicum miliaceum]|uniref:Protein CASP n=1 Tax=Panicum miliaceum TaxID=4540 RepID=A0A3L6S9K1_PANMI|nr:protein CASP [Panicum miliaceum]